VRSERMHLHGAADIVGNAGRQNVLRAAGRVLGLVVVELEMVRGDDIDDVGRLVADDGARELTPGNLRMISGGRLAPSFTMTTPTLDPSATGFATYGGGSA